MAYSKKGQGGTVRSASKGREKCTCWRQHRGNQYSGNRALEFSECGGLGL